MSKGTFFLDIAKGLLIAVLCSLLLVLLFALVVKLFYLPSSVLFPVNQTIKAIAVFLGCFFGVGREKGLFKGAIIGVLALLITFFLFFLISGEKSFSAFIFLELLFGGIIGALSGILAVNIRK